jgi:drug/metabolite transporter (DMT)-like permease
MADARATAASDWLLFLVPSVIWGTTWYAIKFQLGPVAPEASVAYRFTAAALLLLGWCALRRLPLSFGRRDHLRFALLGLLLFGLNYVLVYWSEAHLTSGLVALLFGLMVFWNLLGARLLFGSALTAGALGGAALGLVGVGPDLAGLGAEAGQGLGVALALLGTLAASAGNLWSQRLYRGGVPVVPSTAWAMLYGAAVVGLWCAARGVPFAWDRSAAYAVSLAYLALFGSVFAFVSYLTLLRRIGAGRAGYTAVVIPVMAMGTSTVFEGYRWSGASLAGMGLVLAGNVLVLRRR